MTKGRKTGWRDGIESLRRGHALHVGPLSLVRRSHLLNLLDRLRQAERQIADQGGYNALPLRSVRDRSTEPAGRSVLFLHNAYYNFFYLAKALRKRGWDAVSVSIEDPSGPNARFYHGEDVNLFDADPETFRRRIENFYATVANRFRMVHFYGRGHMSFFPAHFDNGEHYDVLPADFLNLRQRGVKIGYSVCGCLDGVAQSSVQRWSGACDKCVWQHEPAVCSDRRNLAWGHKVHTYCDLIATEGFPALDFQGTEKCYREPLTTALDPDFWSPQLAVPEKYRLTRAPGELIVCHAVGNFQLRSRNGRNLKGSGAVMDAVERLKREGMNVRLEFLTNVPNTEARFIQLQADVIVDQLNYGRYGAMAREGMMLGRPTICFIHEDEPSEDRRLASIEECPLVSATEETIYDVLKRLLSDAEERQRIGSTSRQFSLKWHAADACAARFEEVYDALFAGVAPAACDHA